MFWAFLDHLIWAIFHSGTFGTYDWKKSLKISSFKKVRFQGWLKLAQVGLVEFWGLPTLGSIISGISPSILKILVLILLQIFWSFWNSPNILNLHVFQGCYGQKPKKLEIRKYVNLSQPWNLTFLENEIFQLFFNQMTQKYQNEKSPILNGQKKSKTSEKVQKMRDLEGPTSFRPFENTRYIYWQRGGRYRANITKNVQWSQVDAGWGGQLVASPKYHWIISYSGLIVRQQTVELSSHAVQRYRKYRI